MDLSGGGAGSDLDGSAAGPLAPNEEGGVVTALVVFCVLDLCACVALYSPHIFQSSACPSHDIGILHMSRRVRLPLSLSLRHWRLSAY